MPSSVHYEFVPAPRAAFNDALASEPLLVLAALITVYIVLGVLYESYIHPVTAPAGPGDHSGHQAPARQHARRPGVRGGRGL